MTSIESARCSAYSDDLRWRMVWQREGVGLTVHGTSIAKNLGVDKSTGRVPNLLLYWFLQQEIIQKGKKKKIHQSTFVARKTRCASP